MAKTLTQAAVERLKPSPGRRKFIRDAASRSLFLVIQPSGFRSWIMRFRRSGGKGVKLALGPLDLSRRRATGEPEIGQPLTLVAARQLAAKINAERAAGRDVIADYKAKKHRRRAEIAEAAANSFAAAAKDFIAEHAKPKTRDWKETARNLGISPEDLEPVEDGLADRWSDRDARRIDAHDLYAVIDEARRVATPGIVARKGKSESRARKLHVSLSAMFGWLHRHRRVEVNAMAALHKPDAPAKRDRVLTNDEIQKFWAATNSVADPFATALRLLLLTGARLNEIAQLRWDEVGEDSLSIPGSRTKNRLPFILPLAPSAQEIIAGVPRTDGCAYVFSTNDIAPISGWSKVKRRLDAAIGIPPWRFHDLRRTAATGMSAIGIQPHVVEACLNHISGHKAGVAGIYNQHAYRAEKQEALVRWAAHLEAIVSGNAAKIVPIRSGER